jgi:Fe-S cluster assembly ATP-binding protein
MQRFIKIFSVIILDEIDSGLDIDAIRVLRNHVETWRTNGKTIIIISHNFHLLENIKVDKVLILRD